MTRASLASLLALLLAACGADKTEGTAPEQAPSQAASQPQAPATSVRAVRVTTETVQPWLYGQGTARAVRREFLTFPSAGRVAWIDPKLKVGNRVGKGQLIAYQQPDRAQAEFASARAGVSGAATDLAVARAAQREAQANLELAQETFQRYQILIEKRSASKQEYDEAQARLASARAAKDKADAQIAAIQSASRAAAAQLDQARVTVSESRIVSPIDGVLARLNIERGTYFSPQAVQASSEQGALSTIPVFIIDPSAYEVAIDLPAFNIGQVSVGAAVLMSPQRYAVSEDSRDDTRGRIPPQADASVQGRVHSITPSIDPDKRTFQVKARTSQPRSLLQDGEFVSLWIAGDEAPAASPVVPFDALRYDEGKPFVFVVDPAALKVTRREVVLGSRGRDSQAVIRGLSAGESVVTTGRAALSDGDRVRLLDAAPAASGASR